MAITEQEIRNRFAPPEADPDPVKLAIKVRIAQAAQELALIIGELVPGSREESEAITHLEMATYWAMAGVDRRLVPRGTQQSAGVDGAPGPGGA
ncbi:hypothetical protein [Kitasatospora sp. NPDC058046]|uniref:Acb2/Tad1 domain-containing protein n=1 Tax=Kitasatospora sp. NPDC058046 TaxID=3346312 RepID=UPI0036DACC4B